VVIAAIIFTIRQRMTHIKTVILVIALAVLGYIVRATFAPIPAAPYNRDALAVGVTLIIEISLPFAYLPVRHGIENSPLLKAGTSALLVSNRRGDRADLPNAAEMSHGREPADGYVPQILCHYG
jgi:hypothetical protein